MRSQSLKRLDSLEIEHLKDTLLNPAASVDARIGAIEALSLLSEPDAISVLVQGIFVIGGYKPRLTVAGARNLPPAGEIAGAAARALGGLGEPGIQALSDIIHNERFPRVIRETAVFGLACSDPRCFRELESALNIADGDVRFRTLLTIRELLEHATDDNSREKESLLLAVYNLGINFVRSGHGTHIELSLMYEILGRQLPYALERQLGEELCNSKEPAVCDYALHILITRKSAFPFLIKAFSKDDRPIQVYQLIAETLAESGNSEVEDVARAVVNHYPISRMVHYAISQTERRRRSEHLRVANKLLLINS